MYKYLYIEYMLILGWKIARWKSRNRQLRIKENKTRVKIDKYYSYACKRETKKKKFNTEEKGHSLDICKLNLIFNISLNIVINRVKEFNN